MITGAHSLRATVIRPSMPFCVTGLPESRFSRNTEKCADPAALYFEAQERELEAFMENDAVP